MQEKRKIMKKSNVKHLFIAFDENQMNALKRIALERYGKASVSLLAKNLLQEQITESETGTSPIFHDTTPTNPRFTVSWLPDQYRYLAQKAHLQHASLASVVRDIIQEYMTNMPVLNNDEVQALYQSNYQLVRLGCNINQIARQFNSAMPDALTTKQLNDLKYFLENHTSKVGKILREQDKPFKYLAVRELVYEPTQP